MRCVGVLSGVLVMLMALGCEQKAEPQASKPSTPTTQQNQELPADTFAPPAPTSQVPPHGAQPTNRSRIRPESEPVPDVAPMPKGPAADRPIDDPLAPVAVIQRRFYCFHQDPSPDDVSKLIKVLAARGWMRQGYVSAQVSGFVSVNAERYPESMRAWIDAAERDIPLENCAAVWRGIWNANVEGTEDVLRAYAEEAKDDSARNFIREMVRQPKWFMLDGAVISQLDAHRLIGALVASGDDAHLARVISTIELGTPSNIPLQAVSEQSAAANAKASLAAVCAMNDEILEKVKALKASAEGEMAQELEDVLITTEANRAAAEAQ